MKVKMKVIENCSKKKALVTVKTVMLKMHEKKLNKTV